MLLDVAVLLLFDWPKENPVEGVEAGGEPAPGAEPKLNDGGGVGIAEDAKPFLFGSPRILVKRNLVCQHKTEYTSPVDDNSHSFRGRWS